jgi:hypothetical protein
MPTNERSVDLAGALRASSDSAEQPVAPGLRLFTEVGL